MSTAAHKSMSLLWRLCQQRFMEIQTRLQFHGEGDMNCPLTRVHVRRAFTEVVTKNWTILIRVG